MPCLTEASNSSEFCIGDIITYNIREVDIFISDFGLTFPDFQDALKIIELEYSKEYGSLDFSCLLFASEEFWDFNFAKYPYNVCPFIKYTVYKCQHKLKLSKFVRQFI